MSFICDTEGDQEGDQESDQEGDQVASFSTSHAHVQ